MLKSLLTRFFNWLRDNFKALDRRMQVAVIAGLVVFCYFIPSISCFIPSETVVVTVIVEVTSTPLPTVESTDTPIPEPTYTVAIEDASPTNTSAPAPTERIGVINCPECGDIPLILWIEINDIGAGGGQVMHGDTCIIIDQGVTEGIEKYRLNCDGKIGWLRAEGVQEQ